jgi:hypothetical protein
MTAPKTISGDAGKPNRAVPVTTECAEPGAFTPGPVPYRAAGPTSIPTTDGALYLAGEVIYGEAWAFRHNAEIWGAWCNDATGYSFED